MNIKNERVHKLAKELAQVTGESMTSVIEKALEEKLQRLHHEHDVTEKIRQVDEILDRLPPPPGVTSDHSDLYDEWGLPK